MTKADLFEDLKSLDLNGVEERYSGIVLEIETLDAQRQDLFVQKKIHSDIIKFAVEIEGGAKVARAGAGVEDQQRFATAHLQARRVAAIARGFRSRTSDAAAHAPELDEKITAADQWCSSRQTPVSLTFFQPRTRTGPRL